MEREAIKKYYDEWVTNLSNGEKQLLEENFCTKEVYRKEIVPYLPHVYMFPTYDMAEELRLNKSKERKLIKLVKEVLPGISSGYDDPRSFDVFYEKIKEVIR